MNRLIVLVLIWPTFAFAQSPPAGSAPVVPPQSLEPHACSSASLSREEWGIIAQAATTLSFRIATDGTVKDVVVIGTSHLRYIDEAAVRCVSAWRYVPAKQDGQPVEVVWRTIVAFKNPAAVAEPVGIGSPHLCMSPPKSVAAPSKPTTLSFIIDKHGVVQDPFVEWSSGSDDYDNYAVACVSKWQYRPAVQNGEPVAIRWSAKFAWQ